MPRKNTERDSLAKIIRKKVLIANALTFFYTHEMTKVNKEGRLAGKQVKSCQSISNLRRAWKGDMKVLSLCLHDDRGGSMSSGCAFESQIILTSVEKLPHLPQPVASLSK